MIEWFTEFWNNNSGSIIVSLAVGFLFFVLGPLGLWFSGKKIRRERIRKAKEQLVDLLEGMVVNKSNLDEGKLLSIFRAVEREIDIDLSGDYGIESWLGDMTLRFEKSRHLSADQKNAYYETINALITEVREQKYKKPIEVMSRKFEEIFEGIKPAISAGESEKALELLSELEDRLTKKSPSQDPFVGVFRVYYRLYQKSPVTFVLTSIIALAIYFYVFFKYIAL